MASLHERVDELEDETRANESGIAELRGDMAEVRKDLAAMRGEMTGFRGGLSGLRAELSGLRGEVTGLRTEVVDLRRDMNQRFLAFDQKFTWLLGTQTAVLVAIVGALVGSFYR